MNDNSAAPPITPSYFFSSWIFLRLLALTYLIAFLSLAVQILGLVGSHGIMPATYFLNVAHQQLGTTGYWLIPGIFWLNSSDLFIQIVCACGVLFSVMLFLGLAQPVMLFLLWLLYLSLSSICRDFLSFQWDILLLETGFLAIFLSPPQLGFVHITKPPATMLFLLRWLLFRLMFSSGIVKLLSGDSTWRNLTALNYHYETQPLPTVIGWYVHHLPEWFQKSSVAIMLFIEVLVPFLLFLPRKFRIIGSSTLIGLQILILLTGNYAFFNLLTIMLCILILDDRIFPEKLQQNFQKWRTDQTRLWPKWVLIPVFVFVMLASLLQMTITTRLKFDYPIPILKMYQYVESFRTVNRYGLFAVMTTSRPEIIIEGSNDQREWKEYEFKYKPGDLKRAPAFVAPHQPRLDWQMWFAALGNYQENEWFLPFCQHLLEGSPEVLSLLAKNPFPSKPPKFIRATVYKYYFTNLETKSRDGLWWSRQIERTYTPELWLQTTTK